MSKLRSSGFGMGDKELDALRDALRAKAGTGDNYQAAYDDADRMLHEARMAAHHERHAKWMARHAKPGKKKP